MHSYFASKVTAALNYRDVKAMEAPDLRQSRQIFSYLAGWQVIESSETDRHRSLHVYVVQFRN